MLVNPFIEKRCHTTNLASRATSTAVLKEAFEHVSAARRENHHNSDIWHARANWGKYQKKIRHDVLGGQYKLDILRVYVDQEGERYSRWSSLDAILLKAISLVIDREIIDKRGKVYHLKGEGGLKGAIRDIGDKVKKYKHVVKSDVADFYGSMDHEILLDHCKEIIKDKRLIEILRQYMNRLEVCSGQYQIITQGICRGCPLSPLMGAIILKSLDKAVNKRYGYARYMDDWVILTESKSQLRRVVKLMHGVMKELKFKLALDKTYIGKISKGFEFLGYRFNGNGIIGLASKTIDNFINKTAKLYEQGASLDRIGCYIMRFSTWACLGIRL